MSLFLAIGIQSEQKDWQIVGDCEGEDQLEKKNLPQDQGLHG